MKNFLKTLFILAITVHLTWNANPVEESVTGYTVYYGTATGAYATAVDVGNVTEYELAGVDETQPMFFSLRAHNAATEYGDYATEMQARVVSTTVSGFATIDWAATQAVEDGENHTLTVTPTDGNYRMTAYKIGSTWTEYPASNEITFTGIDENKTVEIIIQRIPSLRP